LERLNGFVPLSRITTAVDPRDATWMWRRLLVGLGWVHRAGVVHGAIVEDHVLIHPGEHGLVDWCYSGNAERFADGCLYGAPRMRPQDAWALLEEFDELLNKLYGPRTFRPLNLD
jgi:aminoglycoside phosphotransferase (APT) family kinase protein